MEQWLKITDEGYESLVHPGMQIHRLHGRAIYPVWDQLVPLIERGLYDALDFYDLRTVQQRIVEGSIQCFVVMEHLQPRALFLTQLQYYPQRVVLHILAAAGKFYLFKSFYPHFVKWAKNLGVQSFTAVVGDAQARLFARYFPISRRRHFFTTDIAGD